MRLIDADARVTVQSFDPMNEEYDHTEMSVEQALDFSTDEGCPQVVDAITVEWLRQQFYDNPNSQWAEKCRDVFIGWQKWQRLQKEHENLQEAIKQWKKYCKDYTNNHGLSYYGCMFEIDGFCNGFPKDVYPTWYEWLTDQAVMVAGERGCYGNILPTNKLFTPIPADIAEKLGIKPKEDA